MLVPAVPTASTSPSPAKLPPMIATVALARSRLSGSDTLALPASVACWPSVKPKLPGRLPSAGESLIAVMLMVVVAAVLRLLEPEPSLSTQVTVRVGLEP